MKRSPRFLITALVAALLTGCATPSPTPSCCINTDSAGPFTDKSIYQTESQWTTDQQQQIKLGDLAGHPQVVAMFFVNCQFACPIIVNDMQRLAAALPAGLHDRVRFTLVTFDVKRDTPSALAQYRQAHNLPLEQWALLHGQLDDVLELALLLGLKFKADANDQFSHSNVITILNAQGEIVHQQVGLNQNIQETVRILQQLATK
jgi:protein SCO1/2